jgi:hypothetical protein
MGRLVHMHDVKFMNTPHGTAYDFWVRSTALSLVAATLELKAAATKHHEPPDFLLSCRSLRTNSLDKRFTA